MPYAGSHVGGAGAAALGSLAHEASRHQTSLEAGSQTGAVQAAVGLLVGARPCPAWTQCSSSPLRSKDQVPLSHHLESGGGRAFAAIQLSLLFGCFLFLPLPCFRLGALGGLCTLLLWGRPVPSQ